MTDSLALLEHRVLNWLPEGRQVEFWLIEFACVRDRGYDGIGAVWDDSLTVLGSKNNKLSQVYAELLAKAPGFPAEKDPEELLITLNPNCFG